MTPNPHVNPGCDVTVDPRQPIDDSFRSREKAEIDPNRCETCAIPWEYKAMHSIFKNPKYVKKYPDCPIRALRDAVGSSLVGSITSKISCSAWIQITCSDCGKPIEGRACDYCGRPHCVDCLRAEEDLDEQT